MEETLTVYFSCLSAKTKALTNALSASLSTTLIFLTELCIKFLLLSLPSERHGGLCEWLPDWENGMRLFEKTGMFALMI